MEEQEVSFARMFKNEFKDFLRFMVPLGFDMAKNLALLGALYVVFEAAQLLEKAGMDGTHLKQIEDLHFWVTYGALAWISVVFIAKLVRRSLS